MPERWYWMAANGLWILGLSMIVAALSWRASLAGESAPLAKAALEAPDWRLPRDLGLCLTCIGWGLAQTSRRWETTAWLLLGVWFGRTGVARWLSSRIGRDR
jgi:hypothetical protein